MASGLDENKTVEKLRSLFHLLDPENSSLSKSNNGKDQEVWDRLEFINQCSRRVSDYYRKTHPTGIKCGFNSIIPRFMQLLRESVLSHQWPEALELVKTLSSEVKGTDTAVWKVGLACLYQDKERNSRLVEQFVKQVYVLKSLTVVEVLLDYLLFLLTQSNTKDAKLLVQELKQNAMYSGHLKNEKRIMAQTLFNAYQGLALYAEWKLAIFKADHEQDETDIFFLISQGSAGRAAKALAEDAVEYLETVKDSPGVWDIFITRLVEIYEYYGKTDESREILISFRDKNPSNPNAHRYLYEFECNHDGEESVLILCLQNIIKMDPCNSLCLNLFNLTEKNDPAAVSLLFDYLDYTHCNGHEPVWEVLADKLSNIDSPDVEKVVRECWNVRKDWWPTMVFKYLDPVCHLREQSQSSTLKRNKKIVWKALLLLDGSFVRKKRTRDVSGQESDLESTEQGKKWKTE